MPCGGAVLPFALAGTVGSVGVGATLATFAGEGLVTVDALSAFAVAGGNVGVVAGVSVFVEAGGIARCGLVALAVFAAVGGNDRTGVGGAFTGPEAGRVAGGFVALVGVAVDALTIGAALGFTAALADTGLAGRAAGGVGCSGGVATDAIDASGKRWGASGVRLAAGSRVMGGAGRGSGVATAFDAMAGVAAGTAVAGRTAAVSAAARVAAGVARGVGAGGTDVVRARNPGSLVCTGICVARLTGAAVAGFLLVSGPVLLAFDAGGDVVGADVAVLSPGGFVGRRRGALAGSLVVVSAGAEAVLRGGRTGAVTAAASAGFDARAAVLRGAGFGASLASGSLLRGKRRRAGGSGGRTSLMHGV